MYLYMYIILIKKPYQRGKTRGEISLLAINFVAHFDWCT